MTPYFQDESTTIYHGDAAEVVSDLPAVDLVVTDPPYGIAYVTAWRSHSDKLRAKIKNDESLDVLGVVWPMLMQKLRHDSHWYVFASPKKIHDCLAVVGNAKQTLCWDKGDRGTVGDLKCGFGEAWEAILYGMKGRRSDARRSFF